MQIPAARWSPGSPQARVPAYRAGAREWDDGAMPGTPRFLTLADVAEVLNTSSAQVYALVRRGDLPAIKIGGRGQWRVEARSSRSTSSGCTPRPATFVDEHPFVEAETGSEG